MIGGISGEGHATKGRLFISEGLLLGRIVCALSSISGFSSSNDDFSSAEKAIHEPKVHHE
jgi:hypothetical protein